jgi:chromosome segregation ATPase
MSNISNNTIKNLNKIKLLNDLRAMTNNFVQKNISFEKTYSNNLRNKVRYINSSKMEAVEMSKITAMNSDFKKAGDQLSNLSQKLLQLETKQKDLEQKINVQKKESAGFVRIRTNLQNQLKKNKVNLVKKKTNASNLQSKMNEMFQKSMNGVMGNFQKPAPGPVRKFMNNNNTPRQGTLMRTDSAFLGEGFPSVIINNKTGRPIQ